ncbi:MAG: metal-sulfur cluster assembly factor [Chloroflexi bacterium]|nr:metal-sulfur cluster assembly factor [Chloroflexota bacterium]
MTEAGTPALDEIRSVLKTVFDPEIGINIVDLGLVYDIKLEDAGKTAVIAYTLTTPACPVGPMLQAQMEQVVGTVEGIDTVKLDLVFSPPWDPREMASDEAKFELGIF